MRKLWKAAIPLILGVGLMLGTLTTSAAPAEQFTDIQGHWARATLEKAYDDGILKGTSATTMSPNASITKAQAVTLLCRILRVSGQGDAAGLGIPSGAWYAGDAAHGVYLGLLDGEDAGTLDKPITRGEAFALFSAAFQNVRALPGREGLNSFSDAHFLTGEIAFAAENLIDSGVIIGSNGKLMWDKSLTRAEFVTMLYRIADTFLPAETYAGQAGKGAVLSGDAALTGVSGGDLWFDQTASSISLTDTSAEWAVVRSDELKELTLAGSGHIGTLVLAASQGDLDLTIPEEFDLSALTLGDGGGAVSVTGALPSVEVTGSGRTLTVNADPSRLVISGNGNTVTINNKNAPVDQIIIAGRNNSVILNGKADSLRVEGRDNTVSGSGKVTDTTLLTRYCQLDVSKGTVHQWDDYDLHNVKIRVDCPGSLPAGERLEATAHITYAPEEEGRLCTGAWVLNGETLQEAPIILGDPDPVSDIEVPYTHGLQQDATLQYVLTYENNDGDTFTAIGGGALFLETFDDLGLADASVQVIVPERLPAGETLHITAPVTSPENGKVCTGYWYVNGQLISYGRLTLGLSTPQLDYHYTYYYGMPATSDVTFKVTYTTEDGREQEISDTATVQIENYPDNGISGATAALNAPATLPSGNMLNVTANIHYLEAGKSCTAVWYVDGQAVSTQSIVLGTDTPTLSYKTNANSTSAAVKLVLSCTTQDGRQQTVEAAANVALQKGPTDQEVLSSVTSAYAGNYTLAWAQNHDYTPEVKTRWVNLKGYASKSKYLIWVNLTYQRVNIFEGSQGNWKLIRSCLCGSGKPSTPTIRGVFATTYKQNAWSYGSYYCGPVVRFYGGYAFHSRLEYWPMGSGRYYDARIGFPISHGCLRMYDDDIWFIYNNIPNGTTVVVH